MKQRIKQAIQKHGTGVLEFSGGKDSLAVLHAAKDWADKITVLWTDMGDTFPHVKEFILYICDLWGYTLSVVTSDVHTYQQSYGLPSDILPFWSTAQATVVLPEMPNQLLVSPFDCCAANLWQPMQRAVMDSGTSLVIRGSKQSDVHIGVPDGFVDNGVEYVSPAWHMTDRDIYDYLLEHGVMLPMQYQYGVNHSLDCATCTAWMDTEAERQRIEFTRDHYPELFTQLQCKTHRVWDEIGRQVEAIEPALRLVDSHRTD